MEVEGHQHMNGHGVTVTNSTATSGRAVPAPYQEMEPSFKCHRFTDTVLGQEIAIEVLKMNSSVYIWVGPASKNTLENIALAIPSRFSPLPLASTWFGETDVTSPISQKLSAKLKKPVILSFNIQGHVVSTIEQILFSDIKNNPEHY